MDYQQYTYRKYEVILYGLCGFLMAATLAYLFYGSILLSFVLGPMGGAYLPYKKRHLIQSQKKLLENGFKDGLYALSASMSAGKSIELAVEDAVHDLKVLYQKESHPILVEFEAIVKKLYLNVPIESCWMEFAQRAHVEDIQDFANVFSSAKRSGGNLVEIIQFTVTNIGEKVEIMNTIECAITGKKYEQKILALMLPLLLIYLKTTSGGMLDCMYQTMVGRLIMTVALGLYLGSFLLGKRIMNIEV